MCRTLQRLRDTGSNENRTRSERPRAPEQTASEARRSKTISVRFRSWCRNVEGVMASQTIVNICEKHLCKARIIQVCLAESMLLSGPAATVRNIKLENIATQYQYCVRAFIFRYIEVHNVKNLLRLSLHS